MLTPPQRLTDRKREAIVQAAIGEFRLQGFAATSVDKIALAASVSKRTLYNHFASKEDLFAEILRVLWQSSAAQTELPYRPDQPVRDQLQSLVAKKMALLAEDDFLDLARVAITALIHSPGLVQDTVDRLAQKEAPLLDWIVSAQKDRRLKRGDASLLAQQLTSLINGAAFWPQVTMGQAKLSSREQRKLGRAAVDLFLSHYGV
jgi:TetR/AcrR family transcriptional regulator, regulator of autoinduction and epiphytic fitness